MLANLIGNALKYSPASAPVSVVVQRHPGEIEVAVADEGMGIPAEELPRLFERFHRTPQAQASGLPGTGLGLSICQGIIEIHEGRIWPESAGVGQGATFRFTLPIGRLESTRAAGLQQKRTYQQARRLDGLAMIQPEQMSGLWGGKTIPMTPDRTLREEAHCKSHSS